jgi:valyl-tRNA synthetase
MLGDTAVAVHPDPEEALAKAEAALEQKLTEAPEKEKSSVQAQLEELAERRRTLLPRLMQLRDMARAGRKVRLPLLNREIPLVADEWAKRYF